MVDVEEEVFGALHDEGAYECVVKGIKKVESEKEPGEYYRVWTFGIVDTDEEIGGTSSLLMGPGSKAYEWAMAILGGKPPTGHTFADLLGRKVIVTIVHKDGKEKIPQTGGLHPVIVKAKPKTVEAFDGDDPR